MKYSAPEAEIVRFDDTYHAVVASITRAVRTNVSEDASIVR